MMTRGMTQDLSQKLGGYYTSLQTRYGDPRVYQAQQAEMARDQAAIVHAKAQSTAQTMKSAYERQQQRNRALHNTRIKATAASKKASSAESAQRPVSRKATAPARSAAAGSRAH